MLLGYAGGYVLPSKFHSRVHARPAVKFLMKSVHEDKLKIGTGQNGMTETGWQVPFVEKVKLSDCSVGYEWKVAKHLETKKMSIPEKVKATKSPLALVDEIEMLAEDAREAERIQRELGIPASICTAHETRLKWLGLFHRGKISPGTCMWRFRLPNGVVSSKQMLALSEIVREYDDGVRDMWNRTGCADITTRMNLQIRGIKLENLPNHWRMLREAGIFSMQTGMDNVRNVVGNPIAGIDPAEIIDTRPFCEEFSNRLTNNGEGNPDYANLPRKFNVCYVGSPAMLEHPHINDLAFLPARSAEGVLGWNVLVGGILSSTLCEFAIPLDAWVPLHQHWELADSVLTTFRDFGFRYKPRGRCRLMFLINAMGLETFREEVARRFFNTVGHELLRTLGVTALSQTCDKKEDHDNANVEDRLQHDLLGAHRQANGQYWLGVHVPVGRLFHEEMKELALIGEDFGTGEIRLTVDENLLIPNVAEARLAGLLDRVRSTLPRLSLSPLPITRGTVACTGNQWCGFAVINTKGNAIKFGERLDAALNVPKPVRIHWTGCTNTCAQAQIADIGLVGTKGKNSKGEVVECVDIFVGGGVGVSANLGECVQERVPIDEQLEQVLTQLLVDRFGAVPKIDEKNLVTP